MCKCVCEGEKERWVSLVRGPNVCGEESCAGKENIVNMAGKVSLLS